MSTTCISCGEPVSKSTGAEDITFDHKFCKKCASKFAKVIMHSGVDETNPDGTRAKNMPDEINNNHIVSWNPKEKKGETRNH